jgi:hypothetical protein
MRVLLSTTGSPEDVELMEGVAGRLRAPNLTCLTDLDSELMP